LAVEPCTGQERDYPVRRGVSEHGEVRDLADAGIAILSFQDPDDISVEVTAALG
jgi:hypothetical protein